MNSNLFQTILTVIISVCGILTTILVSLGCTANATGALDCSTASGPTWLVPWLVIVAAILGPVKLILASFEGKLTAPTVAVPKAKPDK